MGLPLPGASRRNSPAHVVTSAQGDPGWTSDSRTVREYVCVVLSRCVGGEPWETNTRVTKGPRGLPCVWPRSHPHPAGHLGPDLQGREARGWGSPASSVFVSCLRRPTPEAEGAQSLGSSHRFSGPGWGPGLDERSPPCEYQLSRLLWAGNWPSCFFSYSRKRKKN